MRVEPCNASLGATISEVSLGDLSDAQFAEILEAWHTHAVLIFPGQHLADEVHLAFSERFGRLEKGLKTTATRGVGRLSNVSADGSVVPENHLQRRFQLGNQQWHSDSSYKRVGAKASLLAAHIVPADGGQTEWADLRAAYDALPPERQAWLADKVAVHSYEFSHTWHGGKEHLSPEELAKLPPVEHAIVKTHPDTGRKNLFVGRHASHILGEDEASSRELLRTLTAEACQPPRTLLHNWEPGDLVLWDNRCVLHRGHPWPAEQARVMVRTTVAGDDAANEWAIVA